MRFGPVAVPVAIVAAFFVIVGAEAGWFDGGAPEPSFIRADRDARKVAAAPAAPRTVERAAASDDAPAIGRSVGRDPAPTSSGSGGASLDADGVASAGPQELLRQAREEAAKAKQDVLDVTRASLDAQHASEAEFARQRDEFNERNATLAAEVAAAREDAAAAKRQLAEGSRAADKTEADKQVAQAEAASRVASEALARSRDAETRLRAELAELRSRNERDGATAAATAAAAVAAVATRDAALKSRTVDLARANDSLAAERGRVAALTAQAATLRTEADVLRLARAAQASGTARLREAAAAAEKRQAALGREIGEMRSQATADAEQARAAAAAAAGDAVKEASAAKDALARAQNTVRSLETRLAGLESGTATGRSAVTDGGANATVQRLQGDLEGARRGEDTLRKENGMLQRQLAAAQASGKALGEKLAALQVGAGLAKPEPLVPRVPRGRRPSASAVEHQRLVDELGALQRKQMQGELDALRREADVVTRPRRHRDRRQETGARMVTVQPGLPSSARRQREPAGPGVEAMGNDGDDQAVIARARAMIRAGQLDGARHMLGQHGGAAATRALADSYNPLTNTDYGAIGVDSDADKAAVLYQQAGRLAVRDR